MKQLSEQSVAERIAGLEAEIADKKIEFPPEIFKYVEDNILALQRISRERRMPTEKDMEFMEHVRMWLSLDEVYQEKFSNMELMLSEPYYKEAVKRGISIGQWLDLQCILHSIILDSTLSKSIENLPLPEKIDRIFKFPGNGIIKSESTLQFILENHIDRFPDGLDIDGDFKIGHSLALTKLPKRLKVKGDLFASNCPLLSEIPNDISVGEDVILSSTSIRTLPDSLKVINGSLYLRSCENLEKLPDNLKVRRDFCLEGCIALKRLPKGLKAYGRSRDIMEINYCTALEEFPDDARIITPLIRPDDIHPKILADIERLHKEKKIKEIRYERRRTI